MKHQPVSRRLVGRRLLRVGYRAAAAGAHAWWSLRGSHNRGAKCVLFHDGDILLVRHTYGDRRAWDFPGGFVRRKEDPRVAARREVAEELGVEPPALSAVGSLVTEIGRRSDTVFYFHGQLPDRRLAPDDVELAEVAWFDPRALPRCLGEHVAQVVAPFADRGPTATPESTLAPTPAPIAGGPAARSGQSRPEPVASLETDPGSPVRG